MTMRESCALEIIRYSQALAESGLNVNSSGNFSIRIPEESGFLITPSGVPYEALRSEDICFVHLENGPEGAGKKPSSEWELHALIYRYRPDLHAIAHTHSPMATVLACREEAIPPFHYMIATGGSDHIPCAEYATFGSRALGENCVRALGQNAKCCLLSHHGVVAAGKDAQEAAALALEVENLARMWVEICKLGGCKLLDCEEMARVLEKFQHYGQRGR